MKSKDSKQLINDLYCGNYNEILQSTLDRPKYKLKAEDMLPIIGALSFSGRVQEATDLYEVHSKKVTKKQLVPIRFFIGINLFRLSRNPIGKKMLIENLKLKDKSHEELFYTYQGLAFIRFFTKQLNSCKALAEKASQEALSAEFYYGRMLSADMLGHVLISKGEIHSGLKKLDQAISFAKQMKAKSWQSSFLVSYTVYQTQFGINGANAEKELTQLLKNHNYQDSYSQAYLYLELGRYFTRNAEFNKADETLDLAVQNVYRSRHHKQQILLNLRLAELSYQKGEFNKALNLISVLKNQGFKFIDDPEFKDPLNGIEQKLTKALGMTDLEVSKEIDRKGLIEDPIAQLRQEMKQTKEIKSELIKDCEKLACQCFLIDYLDIQRGKNALLLNALPGRTLLFGKTGIYWAQTGRSQNLISLIHVLFSGWNNKEKLVKKIWGYDYDPMRHDPMLFSALQGLRRCLGPYSDWLLRTEEGYCLDPEVQFKDCSQKMAAKAKKQKPASEELQKGLELDFNFRQIRLLESEDFNASGIDVKSYKKQFKVSQITATRDLSDLLKQNAIRRVGKGRATRYLPLGY